MLFRSKLNVTLEPGVTFYSSDIYAANQDKVKNVNYQTFTDNFVFTVPITQDFLEKMVQRIARILGLNYFPRFRTIN